VIQSNTLNINSSGCGIYLAAVGGYSVSRVQIADNIHANVSIGDSLYFYDDASLMSAIAVGSHIATGATESSYFSNRPISISTVGRCSGLSGTISAAGVYAGFGSKSLTISGAYAVTNITGGYTDGDQINIRGFAGASLVQNTGIMRLRGGANASYADSNGVISLVRQTGIWFEVSRNF
ncbi:TPA: hypothetical protein ISA58_002670, partial [Escherichia coli]|nr:hypothetical protein [Escherichia coli]HAP1875026.1 hypothetical protein [Escherichia coli]